MASSTVSSLTASDALAGTELFYADGLASAVATDVKVTSTQIKTWTSSSPTLVTPTIGIAIGTSLALNGVTLGTNKLAIAGTGLFNLNAASAPTGATGTGVQLVGTDATVARFETDSFGAIGAFTIRRANGTGASPTALASSDQIGAFNFHGYYVTGGPGYSGVQASVGALATQNWTSTNQGTQILLRTTPDNSTTLTTAVTIGQDQSVAMAGTSTIATSLAIGGATIGTNALAVTGTSNISGNTTLGSTALLLWSTDVNLSRNAAGIIQFGTNAANAAGGWLAAKGTLTGGTLADQANVLGITATQPASPSATQNAISIAITSAGSASQTNAALNLTYAAGYTGSFSTIAGFYTNQSAGTGSTVVPASGVNGTNGNFGFIGNATATTAGYNSGGGGLASGGNVNAGVLGLAQVAKNSATNIGVIGSAINTGTSPVQIGGFFSLNQTTVPTVNAALIADNGAQTDAIALFRDNNTTKISIVDGGQMTFAAAVPLAFSSGTNQRAGNATLVGGTVTVSNTTVTANTVVMLTRKTSGGTIGTAITYTVSAATSFTISSDNILDTSTFSYVLIEVP